MHTGNQAKPHPLNISVTAAFFFSFENAIFEYMHFFEGGNGVYLQSLSKNRRATLSKIKDRSKTVRLRSGGQVIRVMGIRPD
jgi:hypothetical protein